MFGVGGGETEAAGVDAVATGEVVSVWVAGVNEGELGLIETQCAGDRG